MYTKMDLMKGIESIGIKSSDTLLIHSSMKSLGEVEGGADTVLDAFMEYMKDGLLIFPTHTWAQMNETYNIFNPDTEPSCVGILTNLFMKRPNVYRSIHPTHSVAAYGKDAAEYVKGEEQWGTPCSRGGCWGKLYDRNAKILFLGCTLKRNTFLHGVEEWNGIPERLVDTPCPHKIVLKSGELIDRPVRGHSKKYGDISQNYDKMEKPFLAKGIAQEGKIGDARSVVCDVVGMADYVSSLLKRNPELFVNDLPVPKEWY